MAAPVFELNSIPEDVDAAVYPNKKAVPKIWMQEKRAYHSSTKKEIIHQALSWHAYIKLWKNGEAIKVFPTSVKEKDQAWYFIGQLQDKEIHFTPDQWQEMQLILPTINDT